MFAMKKKNIKQISNCKTWRLKSNINRNTLNKNRSNKHKTYKKHKYQFTFIHRKGKFNQNNKDSSRSLIHFRNLTSIKKISNNIKDISFSNVNHNPNYLLKDLCRYINILSIEKKQNGERISGQSYIKTLEIGYELAIGSFAVIR